MALAEAAPLVRGAYAKGLRPDPVMTVSDWADAYRIVPSETSANPGPWRTDLVPFTREIMDCLSPSHPAAEVTFKKSAQVSGSEIIANAIGCIIDQAPGPIMAVHPTVDAGKSWAREKLGPSIEATPRLKRKVTEQKSRDGGSTALFKKFPGGFLVITGANSTRGLRQKSIRYLFKDDWSDWPWDVDNQGDPDKMADARTKSYERSGQAKKVQVSTPTIEGACRVSAAYARSDRRRYHVPCPQCGHEQVLRFFPLAQEPFRGGLKIVSRSPLRTVYICENPGYGCAIEHHHKDEMLARGRWIAERPEPGRHPGFQINALYSPFETWDAVAGRFLAAKDDPRQFKTWYNLDLGEAWEERGDAPDWEILFKRREDFHLGAVPPGGLILTGFADVQKDGLFVEVVAWGPGKTSWTVAAEFLAGDPGDETDPCWQALTALYLKRFPDAYGNAWSADAFGVDAGYQPQAVKAWVRRHPKAIATRGVDGWSAPALGTPKRLDIRRTGKVKRFGMKSWPIGTWSLKAEFYALLRKEPPRGGAEAFPPGYCHFAAELDENYFRQITAEYLHRIEGRDGRTKHQWRQSSPDNHFLDCRIGNMALLEREGWSRWTAEQWAACAAERAVPAPERQGDLARMWNAPAAAPKPAGAETEPKNPPGSAVSRLA